MLPSQINQTSSHYLKKYGPPDGLQLAEVATIPIADGPLTLVIEGDETDSFMKGFG